MERWTVEEYREFLRTGKEPRKRGDIRGFQPKPQPPGVRQPVPPDGSGSSGSSEEKPKRQKYGNHRVTVDGKTFDSKHEARIYAELMARVKSGELRCVCRQVRFDLLDAQRLEYVADFVTIGPDLKIEGVYDAKSEATRKDKVYIIKRKLMKEKWGIEIREV